MLFTKDNFWLIRSAICSVSSYGWLNVFRKMGFKIYGIDIDDYCRKLDLLNGFRKVVRAKPENEKILINELENIINEVNPLWIISAPENEIYILVKNEDFFNLKGVNLFHSPFRTIEIIKDKYRMYDFISKKIKHFKCPKTFLLSEALENINEKIDFDEIIIKPKEGRGSANIIICNFKELANIIESNKILIQNFILQEVINGIELSVDVLFSFNGEILNIIPRTRDFVDSGIAIVTTIFWDEKIVDIIKEISSLFTFRFMNNFQFIKRDGDYYLTDINPRFGGASIISWYSKESFQQNLFYLLVKDYDKIEPDISEPKKIRMVRYYRELYFDITADG